MAYGTNPVIADEILDSLLSGAAWTPPAGCYVQLHTGDPGVAGTANISSYTTRTAVTWNSASGGLKSVAATVQVTASWSGTSGEQVTGLSFWDSVTGGTFLVSTQLISPVTITTGAPVNIPTLTAPWQGGLAA